MYSYSIFLYRWSTLCKVFPIFFTYLRNSVKKIQFPLCCPASPEAGLRISPTDLIDDDLFSQKNTDEQREIRGHPCP